jgi:hypothetical protein
MGSPVRSAGWAATLTLIFGIWFIFSPWILGNAGVGNVWNNVIVGILIAAFAGARMRTGGFLWAGWADAILGIWAFFSPWIYGYTANDARFWNSIAVGAAVFILGIWAGGVVNRPRLARP